MKYKVTFFLHCSGMEFPDKRDFGEWDAANPEDAVNKVLDTSFLSCSPQDREYIRGCLSAKMVGTFPNPHAPRTDDVVLVKKDDIPKLARILCDRCSVDCNVNLDDMWKEYGDMYIKDVKAMLGLPEDD